MALPLILPFSIKLGVIDGPQVAFGAYAGLAEMAMRVVPTNQYQVKALRYLQGKKDNPLSGCEPIQFCAYCFEMLELGDMTMAKIEAPVEKKNGSTN